MGQGSLRPILLGPDEGEAVSSRGERWVAIKADLPALSVTESRYAGGERGPDPHVHREHADCFWVLEGELSFELGAGGQARLEPDAFLLVPPGVVHSFHNPGPGEARFLNFHAPDAGFAAQLRDPAKGFDSFAPPDDGGRPASDVVLRAAGEGELLRAGPSSVAFKAEVSDAIGTLSLTETKLGPGFPGPLPHRHASTVDSFYVLDGTLSLQLGEERFQAGPGSYALVPPGNTHAFANESTDAVRMLKVMAPAGIEQYLKEAIARMPPGAQPDPELMAEIASRYDFEPA